MKPCRAKTVQKILTFSSYAFKIPSDSDVFFLVTWKRINTETTQHGNASKKQNHKTNLMSSSLDLKLKRLYSTDFNLNTKKRSSLKYHPLWAGPCIMHFSNFLTDPPPAEYENLILNGSAAKLRFQFLCN